MVEIRDSIQCRAALAFVGLVCTFLAANVTAQTRMRDVKIRGYVTEFRSPTSFDIEDYRISRDEGFVLDFENASPEITFSLDDIRVGVELEVRGQLNEATGELKANPSASILSNSNLSSKPQSCRHVPKASNC